MVEDNHLKICYVNTGNNYADIGSKNQTVTLFQSMETKLNSGMLLEEERKQKNEQETNEDRGAGPAFANAVQGGCSETENSSAGWTQNASAGLTSGRGA